MKKILLLLLLCTLFLSSCVVNVGSAGFLTLELIKEARTRILAENPGVDLKFYEFTGGVRPEGSAARGETTIDDLIWWEFVFDCNQGDTAVITKSNGVWQPSVIVEAPWLEDVVFESDYLRIDLADAIEILKIAYWGEEDTGGYLFDFVVFRQPLNPSITEPYYIFTVGFQEYVFVGAITGIVKYEFDS